MTGGHCIRGVTLSSDTGTNLWQISALRWIDAHSSDQSVAIGSATTDCCTFAGRICCNSARHCGLLQIRGTNLSQFGALRRIHAQSGTNRWQISALRRIAAHSRDQSVAIGSATTDCCTHAGPICRNSARHCGLLQIRGTNLSQFGALRRIHAQSGTNRWQISALRRIAAHSRDQSVAIGSATTDCCTHAGPICRNSARHCGLLQIRGTNLSQFGALRRIHAQSGTNRWQISALRRIAAHSRDQFVAIGSATTDCCTHAGPICRNSTRHCGLLHIRGTNM